MVDPLVKITADDREVASGIPDLLRAQDRTEVIIQRLPLGDYLANDQLLFERKSMLDLVASISDGRLFRQASQLASSRPRAVLILEGTGADLANCHMRREAIQGALITVTLGFGIPLLRSTGPTETAQLMLYAMRQFMNPLSNRAYPRQFLGGRPTGKRKKQLHIMQGLPGVGPERAHRLLDRFGSVEAVMQASTDDLLEVEGVGERIARAIRWAVSENAISYSA